jgi:hypothetical protein
VAKNGTEYCGLHSRASNQSKPLKKEKPNRADFRNDIIMKRLDGYITDCKYCDECQCRRSNLSEYISEGIIAAFAKTIFNCKYERPGTGDLRLTCDADDSKIFTKGVKYTVECKAYSKGPMSFGPKPRWDILCLLDHSDIFNYRYKIYVILMSDKEISKINVSEKDTFQKQATQNRRPRINGPALLSQLPPDSYSVYEGSILDLFKN